MKKIPFDDSILQSDGKISFPYKGEKIVVDAADHREETHVLKSGNLLHIKKTITEKGKN